MRKYEESPKFSVTTDAGEITITVTALKSLYIDFTHLTVRNVEYRGCLRLDDNGSGFEPDPAYGVFAHRNDQFHCEATRAAKSSLSDIIVRAVRDWAPKHRNSLRAGEQARLNNAILEVDGEIEKKAAEIAKLAEKRDELQRQEEALG